MAGRVDEEYGKFIVTVWNGVRDTPRSWRLGQAVFNVIDSEYDVARKVQLEDGVDCFYDDKKVDDFISACWERIKKEKGLC